MKRYVERHSRPFSGLVLVTLPSQIFEFASNPRGRLHNVSQNSLGVGMGMRKPGPQSGIHESTQHAKLQ